VHVHEPLVAPTSPAAFLGKGPPALGTFHADPSAIIRRLYRLAGPGLRPIIGRLGAVTAVSRESASAVDHLVDEIVHVPNAIDVAAFSTDVERNPYRVVFLGRDEPRKGLDVLLAAWPMVSAAVPQAELLVLGADRDTSEMGIRFLGTSLGREKGRHLAGAAVFCAPNLGGESFGISLVEAMASGCAPVVSDLPAFRSVAGDAAVYVPVGDPASLAGQLIDALGDPDRTTMRGRAAAAAAAAFDWQHVIPTYLDLYARIAR
jgi:phosphatidylinositol alpha-mannosyltransferase